MGTETKSLDEKMADLNRVVDEYNKFYQLKKFQPIEVDIQETIPLLRKLSIEEIRTKVAEWRCYAIAIHNRQQEIEAKLRWVRRNWEKYAGINQQYISKEYGYSARDRQMLLLETDEYARRLYDLQTSMEVELTLLKDFPMHVNFLADVGMQIAGDKTREQYGKYRG